jgi:hypothetical protein
VSLKNKLRHRWHELFYAVTGKTGEQFAMTCKDVSGEVDLGTAPRQPLARVRFYLHLSLCQACANYFAASHALKQIVNEMVYGSASQANLKTTLERLNQELMKKHGRR